MKRADNFASELSRWQAIVQRDQQADGVFVYGVVTTGIYCRPICPSRMPNRLVHDRRFGARDFVGTKTTSLNFKKYGILPKLQL
ncbi:MAG TPA: hypothetical protein G4N96_05420 [Chloroflexi bacterium]|nr:MAG: hypothetical protein B6243_00965 [Anaerolineaceae bacterium 4572_5.2]HEY84537.1 hypothetical protein [Chloroflexota bacterium]